MGVCALKTMKNGRVKTQIQVKTAYPAQKYARNATEYMGLPCKVKARSFKKCPYRVTCYNKTYMSVNRGQYSQHTPHPPGPRQQSTNPDPEDLQCQYEPFEPIVKRSRPILIRRKVGTKSHKLRHIQCLIFSQKPVTFLLP